MDQQKTIFDEGFDEEAGVRRRDILPLVVKIYIWLGMAAGIFFFVYFFYQMFFNAPTGEVDSSLQRSYNVGFAIGTLFPCLILLLMTGLLWFEVKWAIRFNWGIVAFYLFLILVSVLVSGPRAFLAGLAGVVIAPFWILLFRIQKRWEQIK
jgi:hypothetical protein